MQPLSSLSDLPYVRTVEVVALDTLCKLTGARHDTFELADQATNIYSRALVPAAERVGLAHGRCIDVVPHAAWKVCAADRYLVDEISHSAKLAIHGVEFWPGWNGRFDVRYGHGHAQVDPESGPYFLVGGDNNHYHWVLNFVPRLLVLEQAVAQGKAPANCQLVVPAELSDNALRLLDAVGYGADRVTRVKAGQVLRFDALLVPSFFPHFELSPNVFGWYRQKLMSRRKATAPSRRIVISRGDLPETTQRRRVINESAMIEALSPLGFEAHNLGHLTMDEQIDLFLDAEFVVGPHGAGFANMAFCQPGTHAIVLENSWNHTFMADMINVAAGVAEVMVCEDVIRDEIEAEYAANTGLSSELRRNRDMLVDVEALHARVAALLAP